MFFVDNDQRRHKYNPVPRAIHLQHQNSCRQGLRWDTTTIAQPPLPCYCTIISSQHDIRTIVLASPHILFAARIIKQNLLGNSAWINSNKEQGLHRHSLGFSLRLNLAIYLLYSVYSSLPLLLSHWQILSYILILAFTHI